jgi:hypothetical protein
MYKSICVVAVLLAAFAFISGSRSADAFPTASSSPVIVAKGKLLNQTAPIPTTNMFTPTQTGLYRLSVYMFLAVPNAQSCGYWYYMLNWTDSAGVEQYGLNYDSSRPVLSLEGQQLPAGAWAYNVYNAPSQVVTFQAVAGSAVTYSVTENQNGCGEDGTYDLYYALERLE